MFPLGIIEDECTRIVVSRVFLSHIERVIKVFSEFLPRVTESNLVHGE